MSAMSHLAGIAHTRDRQLPLLDPNAALERQVQWLLTGPAQRTDGAVAGWVDADDRADYVYPEITGYYLQWLGWRTTEGDSRFMLGARAAAAQSWLRTWLAAEGPRLTRVYADRARDDWRNHAIFCFDVAMALRGVATAARRGILDADAAVVEGLCAVLGELVAPDGMLDACRIHGLSPEFPLRWSTQRGAFLAKAAAGIVDAAHHLPDVPAALRVAAARSFDASIDALCAAPHDETHPLLYAIEGYLALPAHPCFVANLPSVAARYDELLARTAAMGRVPESSTHAGQPRLDIVAQTLRAGALLAQHGAPLSTMRLARELATTLTVATTPDGALPFAQHAGVAQYNTWATMFATQALCWARATPGALIEVADDPCIV